MMKISTISVITSTVRGPQRLKFQIYILIYMCFLKAIKIICEHNQRPVPTRDFVGHEAYIFAGLQKTFVTFQIRSGVTKPFIKFNPVEGAEPSKSRDPG